MKGIVQNPLEVIAIIAALGATVAFVYDAITPDSCYEYAHSAFRDIPAAMEGEEAEGEYRATLYERCRIESARERAAEESARQ